jgi:predicted Zn-dependent peptidase
MASPTGPGKVDAFRAKIFEMFDGFAKDGPTSEEMETVRKQFANTWDEQMREPGYWSSVLGSLNYRWLTLEDIVAGPEQFQKFTAEEIKDAFNRYYKTEARFLMSVKPEPKAADAKTTDAKTTDTKPAETKPSDAKPAKP